MWWPGQRNWDWYDTWTGWEAKVTYIQRHARRPIWVTETGLATWDIDHKRPAKHDTQVHMLDEAAQAPADRLYWYCLRDLHPDREAIEGFHVDENEYHLGLVTYDGHRKPAWYRFKELMGEFRPARIRTVGAPA